MGKFSLRLPALAMVLATFAGAQSVTSGLASKVDSFRLANGMRFVVVPRNNSPSLTIRMYVAAGKTDEPLGKRGVTRLMELMLREGPLSIGSKDVTAEQSAMRAMDLSYDDWMNARQSGLTADRHAPQQAEIRFRVQKERAKATYRAGFFERLLEQHSIRFSSSVQADYSAFSWSLPSDRTEIWFKTQSEWLRQPSFRGFYEARDKLKASIIQELDLNPSSRLERETIRTVLNDSQYTAMMGNPEELDEIRIADAEAFLHSAYRPAQISVAMVGDIDSARARKWADQYFGKVPAGTQQSAPPQPTPSQSATPKTLEVAYGGPRISAVVYPRPPREHADDAVFDVITLWMKREMALARETLEENHQTNITVTPAQPGDRYKTVFTMTAPVIPGQSFDHGEQAIQSLIEALGKEILPDSTLNAIKTQTLAHLLERMETNQGLADLLADVQFRSGDWKALDSEWKRISQVTAADIRRVADTYLSDEHKTIIRLGAKGAGR